MIDDIFRAELSGRKIFNDLTVLSPHYVPDTLPYREKEVKEVTRAIAPVLRNEKPNNLFIYGKTGTGKTCAVKYVAMKMLDFASGPENQNGAVVRIIYMNNRVRNTMYQVLLRCMEDPALNTSLLNDRPLGDSTANKLVGTTPAGLYEKLQNVVQKNNINLIIILDEIDQIKKGLDDLMYWLTRINDEITSGHVSIIGISNDSRVKNRLDPRSRSTLCEEERVFKPYNATELNGILQQRISSGFNKGVIDDSIVSLISGYAAQDGDARYALRLLQKSGEVAQNGGADRVEVKDVERAKTAVEEDIMFETISTLPEHQQIVIYSIADLAMRGGAYRRLSGIPTGDLFTGEVYDAYEQNCKRLGRTPRTVRQFGDYLNELEMMGSITTRHSGKGIRGNTRLIRISYPPEEIKAIAKRNLNLDAEVDVEGHPGTTVDIPSAG